MRAAQIPCGEVRSVGQALRSPEARARDLVTWIEHPEVGQVPNIASPIRFARTPVVDPTPAPNIGQHSVEILRELLGYDDARIAALAAVGVFGQRVRVGAEGANAKAIADAATNANAATDALGTADTTATADATTAAGATAVAGATEAAADRPAR